jgi:RsiW-degrading membrane proteinase PrsW (M82 family)
MAAVALVLPIQKWIAALLPGMTFSAMLLWVIVEEILKLVAAYFGGLHSVEDNEPIDPLVYTITAALGFVALENTLFIFGPLIGENIVGSVLTGNLRFIGASILHVVSSAMVGFALALSFYRSRKSKITYVSLGLIFAIIFHTAFNLLIIHKGEEGIMISFGLVWIAAIALLLGFEKAKTIAR